MQGLLRIAKGFRPSTEGRHLTDGKILFRLSEGVDPVVVQALFQGEGPGGRPTEERCLELLPMTLTGSLAVPVEDSRVAIKESRSVRKGRKTVEEITEYRIFEATQYTFNDAGSVVDMVQSFAFYNAEFLDRVVSMVRVHYGPFQSASLAFFADPESGRLFGTVGDGIPIFVLCPVSMKGSIGVYSREQIDEILNERLKS